jgi:hypothetical protein
LPSTFTVPPGASQKVVVSFTPPAGLDASRYPLYSGFVEVTSSSESYHVSYIGLAASLKDHQIFDNTTTVVPYPSPSLLKNDTRLVQPTNFTFKDTDFPVIFWRFVVVLLLGLTPVVSNLSNDRLTMGTPALHVDLVDANIQFTPTFQRRGLVAPGITFPLNNPGGSFADVKVIGSVFSEDYQGRHDEVRCYTFLPRMGM